VANGTGVHAVRDKRQTLGLDKVTHSAIEPEVKNSRVSNLETSRTKVSDEPILLKLDNGKEAQSVSNNKLLKSSSLSNAAQLTYQQSNAEPGTSIPNEKQAVIDRVPPIGALKPSAIVKSSFLQGGKAPTIPKPASVAMRGSNRPISAPMLYRPWQESVKVNQKAKISNFLQEREAMVEAIYTAPYSGNKFLGTNTSNRQSKNIQKTEKEDRMQKLQEMYQEDIVERLGQLRQPQDK
jgi:hypothetical protein